MKSLLIPYLTNGTQISEGMRGGLCSRKSVQALFESWDEIFLIICRLEGFLLLQSRILQVQIGLMMILYRRMLLPTDEVM